MGRSWGSGNRLGVGHGLSWGGLVIGGGVALANRRLSSTRVWHTLDGAEWAAAGNLADCGLCPALTLDRNRRGGAKVLIELVGSLIVVAHPSRGGRWDAALTPRLSSVLVLGRSELTSSLGLLLE